MNCWEGNMVNLCEQKQKKRGSNCKKKSAKITTLVVVSNKYKTTQHV